MDLAKMDFATMDPQPCTRNNGPETKESATKDIAKIDPAMNGHCNTGTRNNGFRTN